MGAPFVPRHYVVMEVKQNLTAADRKDNLKRFNFPHFKKVATIIMGEPTAEFKDKVHAKLLESKKAKSDAEWKQKKNALAKAIEGKKKQKELAEKKRLQMEEI